MRFCFVVHRAAPFPGGTEVFMQAMAEEALARGHSATILAGQHQGDLNGVTVTSDMSVLDQPFDMIVVHGSGNGPPRRVLDSAATLPSPVLYMLVAHYRHHIRAAHLHDATLLGWSTPMDQQIIARAGHAVKSTRLRHGILPAAALGAPGFRAKYGIAPDRQMFLSCGGYWSNKRMKPLAKLFETTRSDALLVTTGYDNRDNAMPCASDRVLPLMLPDRADVTSAIAEADCYLMHSRDEGFGLVLLEAMLNETPWISHETGGATVLQDFGQIYRQDTDLIRMIEGFRPDPARIAAARDHALQEYTIARTLDDLELAVRNGPYPRPTARRRRWPFASWW